MIEGTLTFVPLLKLFFVEVRLFLKLYKLVLRELGLSEERISGRTVALESCGNGNE